MRTPWYLLLGSVCAVIVIIVWLVVIRPLMWMCARLMKCTDHIPSIKDDLESIWNYFFPTH